MSATPFSDSRRVGRLVLVTGHPCSGKSTLAGALAARFGLPLLAKDTVKEALFDSLSAVPVDVVLSRRLSVAANTILLALAREGLARGAAVLLESNLRPAHWQAPVCSLLETTGAQVLQIRCHARGDVLLARFADRRRHPGHHDAAGLERLRRDMLAGPLPALALDGELLCVDTSEPAQADLAPVTAAVDRFLAGRPAAGG